MASTLLSTTEIYDVAEISSLDVKSKEFKELIIRLVMNANKQNIAINGKDTGIYDVLETITGQTYFQAAGKTTQRATYRKVIDYGTLPNAAQLGVDHGITNVAGFSITRIYGAATDPTHRLYFPLPYVANSKDEPIALWATSDKVWTDTFATDRSDFTKTYIIVEYLKD